MRYIIDVSTPSFLSPKLPASDTNGNRNAWFNVEHLFRSENSPKYVQEGEILITHVGLNDKGTSTVMNY